MTVRINNSFSEIVDFIHGAVVDNAVALFNFPGDVTRYVLGVDRNMGEGRELSMGQVVSRIWKTYDDGASESANPVTGWIDRSTEVVNSVVYGGLDLLSGHTLNAVCNDHWGMGIKYFSPAPKDARAVGRDLGMTAIIFATPAIKARAYRAVGIEPKPTTPVIEQTRHTARRPSSVPASVYALASFPNVEALIEWIRGQVARRSEPDVIKEMCDVADADIDRLAHEAKTDPAARAALGELVRAGNHRVFTAAKALVNEGWVELLDSLAEAVAKDPERMASYQNFFYSDIQSVRDAAVAAIRKVDASVAIESFRSARKSSRPIGHIVLFYFWARAENEAAFTELIAAVKEGHNDSIRNLINMARDGSTRAREVLVGLARDGDEVTLSSLARGAAYEKRICIDILTEAGRTTDDRVTRIMTQHLLDEVGDVGVLAERAVNDHGAVTILSRMAHHNNNADAALALRNLDVTEYARRLTEGIDTNTMDTDVATALTILVDFGNAAARTALLAADVDRLVAAAAQDVSGAGYILAQVAELPHWPAFDALCRLEDFSHLPELETKGIESAAIAGDPRAVPALVILAREYNDGYAVRSLLRLSRERKSDAATAALRDIHAGDYVEKATSGNQHALSVLEALAEGDDPEAWRALEDLAVQGVDATDTVLEILVEKGKEEALDVLGRAAGKNPALLQTLMQFVTTGPDEWVHLANAEALCQRLVTAIQNVDVTLIAEHAQTSFSSFFDIYILASCGNKAALAVAARLVGSYVDRALAGETVVQRELGNVGIGQRLPRFARDGDAAALTVLEGLRRLGNRHATTFLAKRGRTRPQ